MKTKYNFEVGQVLKTREGKDTLLIYLGEGVRTNSIRRRIKVRCKCGKEWEPQLVNILNGNTSCCGRTPCKSYSYISDKERDVEVGWKALQYVYKRHAEKRGLAFKLTYEEFKNILQQDCTYCGVKPNQVYQLFKRGTKEIRAGVPVTYNGIDRVDSSLGYTLDNTVPCCRSCNWAKMDHSLDHFKKRIIAIYNNLNLSSYVP